MDTISAVACADSSAGPTIVSTRRQFVKMVLGVSVSMLLVAWAPRAEPAQPPPSAPPPTRLEPRVEFGRGPDLPRRMPSG